MAFETVARHWTARRAAARGRREAWAATEFLPAVLEIEHAPPSPIGRAILWTIVASFASGMLWATVSSIDIVATAPGKVLASGYSKVIQPYETGVIAAIRVQDGDPVKKGDVLIELDPTLHRADYDRAVSEWLMVKTDAARLRALIAGDERFQPPPDADPPYVQLQQQLLRDQLAEYRANVAAARHLVSQRQATVDQTRAHIVRLEATVPMEVERAEAYRTLLEHDAVTRMDFLQAEGQRIEKTQELAVDRNRLTQDLAALDEAQDRYRALVSEFQRTKQAELSAVEAKAAALAQEITKAGQRTELQRLTAPIDGVVQQLAVHTVGGVVTPAQSLLVVVPQDHPVEVEVQVQNKDVGFIREGQAAEIKVETFPFTLYGTIPGSVRSVSDDAAPIEDVGLVYPTRVTLQRSTIAVDGRQVPLAPGMAVTVEIKTGRRRVIEYLLGPLLKAINESMRER